MTSPPTLGDLMADPGELDVSGLPSQRDHAGGGPAAPLCRQNAISRCVGQVPLFGLWGFRQVDVRPPSLRTDDPTVTAWTGCAPNWSRRGGRDGGGVGEVRGERRPGQP
jgi:hypothetical protein